MSDASSPIRDYEPGDSNVCSGEDKCPDQEVRHRKMNFEDELSVLFRKHGIALDPKEVFDECRP